MKKYHKSQKMCHDRFMVLVSRIKEYCAKNGGKTFIDVRQMTRSLKNCYIEYRRRPDSAFCQMVENAYQIVLNDHGLSAVPVSERSKDESNLKVPDESKDILNNLLNDMYKTQSKKSTIINKKIASVNLPPSPTAASEESDLERLDESKDIMNNSLLEMYKMDDKKHSTSNRNPIVKSNEPIDITSSDEDGNTGPKISKNIPFYNTKTDDIEKIEKQTSNEKKHKPNIKKKREIIKKRLDNLMPRVVNVSLDDFGGLSEIMPQISKIFYNLCTKESHKSVKVSGGVLLYGLPGTGKTLLAHVMASILECSFFSVTGTDLSEKSEEPIRDLFEKAVVCAPSILFIDEIDSIIGNRSNATNDTEKRMVSQLISCLDNIKENSIDVLVFVATNNPDNLDPALRKAGRLEQEINLGLPTITTRKEILKILCQKLPLDNKIDINSLAELTSGFVGGDLSGLVHNALIKAIERHHARWKNKKQSVIEKDSSKFESGISVMNGDSFEGNEKIQEIMKTPIGDIEKESLSDDPCEPSSLEKIARKELLDLENFRKSYKDHESKLCKVTQEDFLEALKTIKPSSISEENIRVPDVTWDNVGSLSKIKKYLQLAVVAPVKYPVLSEKYKFTPKGVLLTGPPGCGKTLLAKAAANEAGINFLPVKGPELLSMYVGESERAVRTIFRRARNCAPCVIFLDEFDALCPRRNSSDNNGASRVVNQLLTEMDGFETRKGVFVLAASNRPDIIDPAVLRPGRLDRTLYVGMPNKGDREDILKKITKNGTQPPIASNVDYQMIAGLTQGYTGADLAGLVEAATNNAIVNLIESGTLEQDVVLTFDDFSTALSECKPSVSAIDQRRYEKLRIKYASNTDDKDMEIETEPANEECMETV